jgi:hypothetical protein
VFDKSNSHIRIKPALYQIVGLVYYPQTMEGKWLIEVLLVPLFSEKF